MPIIQNESHKKVGQNARDMAATLDDDFNYIASSCRPADSTLRTFRCLKPELFKVFGQLL